MGAPLAHPNILLLIILAVLGTMEFLIARRHPVGGGAIPVALLLQAITLLGMSSPESREIFLSGPGLKILGLPVLVTVAIYVLCRVLARKGYFPQKERKQHSHESATWPHL